MSSFFQADPRGVAAYRASTDRGMSSSGIRMKRFCSKCKAKIDQTGARKVRGTGTSRHNPQQWICQGCIS